MIVMVLPLVLGGCVSALVAASSGIDFEDLSISKLLGSEPEPQRVVQPRYCYETLGREECYLEPLVGAEARLQGFVGPIPAPMER